MGLRAAQQKYSLMRQELMQLVETIVEMLFDTFTYFLSVKTTNFIGQKEGRSGFCNKGEAIS